MAAHGSRESFSFHRRPFFFVHVAYILGFFLVDSIHQVCISAHLFPKKALYTHNDFLRIALFQHFKFFLYHFHPKVEVNLNTIQFFRSIHLLHKTRMEGLRFHSLYATKNQSWYQPIEKAPDQKSD